MRPQRTLHAEALILAAVCAASAWLSGGAMEPRAARTELIQLAQEVFADPVGEDDGPVGGPMAYGAPVGNGPIGGPMVYGDPVGNGPIGGPMVYGDPVGNGPVGGPSMYGAPVDSGQDGEAIGGDGDTLY